MDDRNINLSLSSLWTGLTAPVLALAEETALRRAAGEHPAMELRIRANGIDALRGTGGQRELLLSVAGRPQQALREVLERLAAGIGPAIALSFAPEQSVSQQIVLPQQPDEVLRAIVRNKVESLAPWPLAQCLWGMRSAAIPGDPQHVAVEVVVVSRALMEDLSATLRHAGSDVKALSAQLANGDEIEIELGSGDVRRAARARAVRLARLAAVLAAVILGLGLFWIYRTSAEASRLDEESQALMASMRPSGAPAGEPPQVTAANRLYQMRRERLPAVAVLEELSKLLPDTVHLVALTLDGDQITIKGQGSGVPALIQLLEASPNFQSVNFAAATEREQNSDADAFSLVAVLEKAPVPGVQP